MFFYIRIKFNRGIFFFFFFFIFECVFLNIPYFEIDVFAIVNDTLSE